MTASVKTRPRKAATDRRPTPRTARVAFIYFDVLAPAIETGSPILTNSRVSCVPASIVVPIFLLYLGEGAKKNLKSLETSQSVPAP